MFLKFFLLASVFFLASCVSIDRNNPDDPESDNYVGESEPRSSSTARSSNSVVSRSCPDAVTGDGTVSCGGQTYKTVEIGEQVWMAQNLNYNVPDSKCYNNQDSYCKTYGRLYNWAMAMALPANCISSSCASQITITAKYRGICPEGWHIPSDADWNVLMKYVDPSCTDNSDCPGAGTKLKAKSGWSNKSDGTTGNGTDEYGFAALPGGGGNDNSNGGYYIAVGNDGVWWSATENGANEAFRRIITFSHEYVYWSESYMYFFGSVRCVRDSPSTPSSSSVVPSSSSAVVPSSSSKPSSSSVVPSSSSITLSCTPKDNDDHYYCSNGKLKEYGFVTDKDGQDYKTVEIGTQTWMAENLNCYVAGSKCFADEYDNCDTYGRLYNWSAAKAACPTGWHLPSDAEWTTLINFAGGSSTAGKNLKAMNGWNDYEGRSGNGLDTYGFAALPGSDGGSDDGHNGSAFMVGFTGLWWSATESNANNAYYRYMDNSRDDFRKDYSDMADGLFSVRCLQN